MRDGSLTKAMIETSASSVALGLLPVGSKSNIIILDMVVSNVQSAGALGFGIAYAELGDQNVSDLIRYDVISSLDDLVEPENVVPGLSGQEGISNVIDVGFREPLISNYVVLKVISPSEAISNGCFTIKWFFGFSLKE